MSSAGAFRCAQFDGTLVEVGNDVRGMSVDHTVRSNAHKYFPPNGVVWMTRGSHHNFSLVEKESAVFSGWHYAPRAFSFFYTQFFLHASTSSLPSRVGAYVCSLLLPLETK